MKENKFSLTIVFVFTLVFLIACAPVITSSLQDNAVLDSPYSYQIIADNEPDHFDANLPPPEGLTIDQATGEISGTPSDFGSFDIPISASNSSGSDNEVLALVVSPPSHPVVRGKELLITSPVVLQSASQAKPGGSWHIRSVMQRLAGEDQDVDEFADAWFDEWATSQSINSDLAPARPSTASALKAAWSNDRFRLIAIVNRIDLTRFDQSDADAKVTKLGEGRFIYEMLQPTGDGVQSFTVIFEFGLPRLPQSENLNEDLEGWAKRWHMLGRIGLGNPTDFGPKYLSELENLTDLFSAHGQINQVRTNGFISSPWQLREFRMREGSLKQNVVVQTPMDSLSGKPALVDFINSNEAELINGNHQIPADMLGAKSDENHAWIADGTNNRARFIMSFNTCNGCHTGDTGTGFQMVAKSQDGVAASLAPFLDGEITLAERLPGQDNNSWNEMAEREILLAEFAQDGPIILSQDEISSALLARGNRVH